MDVDDEQEWDGRELGDRLSVEEKVAILACGLGDPWCGREPAKRCDIRRALLAHHIIEPVHVPPVGHIVEVVPGSVPELPQETMSVARANACKLTERGRTMFRRMVEISPAQRAEAIVEGRFNGGHGGVTIGGRLYDLPNEDVPRIRKVIAYEIESALVVALVLRGQQAADERRELVDKIRLLEAQLEQARAGGKEVPTEDQIRGICDMLRLVVKQSPGITMRGALAQIKHPVGTAGILWRLIEAGSIGVYYKGRSRRKLYLSEPAV